jgi:hypothetical protein
MAKDRWQSALVQARKEFQQAAKVLMNSRKTAMNWWSLAAQPSSGPKQGAAQNLRGGEALAEQILRGGAADCEETGGFWVGTSAA